jgi:hypothetical protein
LKAPVEIFFFGRLRRFCARFLTVLALGGVAAIGHPFREDLHEWRFTVFGLTRCEVLDEAGSRPA